MELVRLFVEGGGLDQGAISVDEVDAEEPALAPRVSPSAHVALLHDSSLDDPVLAELVQRFDRHVDAFGLSSARSLELLLFLVGCGKVCPRSAGFGDRKVNV